MRRVAILALLVGCSSGGDRAPHVRAPVEVAPYTGQVVDLVTDGTWAAWCEHDPQSRPDPRQRVVAARLAGGPRVEVDGAGCSAVALHDGTVAWSRGGKVLARPLPAGETRTADDGTFEAVKDLAFDATHLYALRDHGLVRVPRAGGAAQALWAVPGGSVGDEVALGHDSVWVTIADDPARDGNGAVGLHRIDLTKDSVGILPIGGKQADALRVDGDRVFWIASAQAWEMPERGGPPLAIWDTRPDAIDAHGFYVNPRPLGRGPMRYAPHTVGWTQRVQGVAQNIAPLPDGFVASFPRIEAGTVAAGAGVIGVVRW